MLSKATQSEQDSASPSITVTFLLGEGSGQIPHGAQTKTTPQPLLWVLDFLVLPTRLSLRWNV